ncbi:MAG: hypothetical protein O7H39_11420, partial [Gammaproteobacteria bacterium]|nr:hypothetical protein [Gammaproteobacteria bacterium]
ALQQATQALETEQANRSVDSKPLETQSTQAEQHTNSAGAVETGAAEIIEGLRIDVDLLETSSAYKNKVNEALTEDLDALNGRIGDLTDDLKTRGSQLETLETSLADLNKRIEQQANRDEEQTAELRERYQLAATLKRTLKRRDSTISAYAHDLEIINSAFGAATDSVATSSWRLSELAETLDACDAQTVVADVPATGTSASIAGGRFARLLDKPSTKLLEKRSVKRQRLTSKAKVKRRKSALRARSLALRTVKRFRNFTVPQRA